MGPALRERDRSGRVRAVHRLRLEGRCDDLGLARLVAEIGRLCRMLHVVALTEGILDAAGGPFPTVVGTLDAIHLATAVRVRAHTGAATTFLTHDVQQATSARALGFPVEGVPESA